MTGRRSAAPRSGYGAGSVSDEWHRRPDPPREPGQDAAPDPRRWSDVQTEAGRGRVSPRAGLRRPPRPVRLLLTFTVPALALVLAALLYARLRGFSPTDSLTDPAQAFGYSGRWGAVSQIGVMLWAAAAALALRGAGDRRLSARLRAWLRRAGLLTVRSEERRVG